MSITSETQRKYDPNKGGFSYYTLFHADKGERPSWAQDGDMLEEFGEGGKAYVCSRDAKGRIKWTEKADWDRQTGGGSGGSGGGSLPANFPTEDILNADKLIGFDENGDYAALDAPSGGGAEKFVVTLTADDSGEETVWTADKTVAEIVEAHEAKQVVVALYPVSGSVFVEIPCNVAAVVSSSSTAIFCGNYTIEPSTYNVVSIVALNTGGDDAWDVDVSQKPVGVPSYSSSNNGQVLGVDDGDLAWVDSNEPLIVTMTADEQTPGTFVGDKTYLEVYTAFVAGRSVRFSLEMDGATSATNVDSAVYDPNNGYEIAAGSLNMNGTGADYISFIAH